VKPILIEAGLLIRRQIRRFLMENGIVFKEERGLIDSLFVIPGSAENAQAVLPLVRLLKEWNAR
jgi:hypothetical protein